jgi:hypothetical protein
MGYQIDMIENSIEDYMPKEERSYPRLKCNYVTDCSNDFGN